MLLRSFPLVALALALPFVTGQTTEATCLPFYAWTNNSRKQSPCQVASTLLAICGPYDVAALPTNSHYSGPALGDANPCICNTVVYSLMSACGACQGETFETWSTWSGNCPSVAISAFPEAIPPQTFVPGWAYLDVETNGGFNETAARLVANTTAESTAPPIPTPTSASITVLASSTSRSITSSSAPASTASAATDADHHANIVMGAIIGSTFGAALLLGIVFLLFRRQRRLAKARGVTLTSSVEEAPPSPQIQGPETADMRQYLANTAPSQLAASSINTSLPSPTSAQFPNMSKPGSVRSNVPSSTV